MKKPRNAKEPRLRIVLSPNGIERVEVWGLDERDQDTARQLYFKLTENLRQLNEACRA